MTTTQAIQTDVLFDSHGADQMVLLQAEPDFFLQGQTLKIKANGQGASVLCTPSATFALREVRQSNTLLFLARPSNQDGHLIVRGQAASWLETAPSQARCPVEHLPDYVQGIGPLDCPLKATFLAKCPASDAELERLMRDSLIIEVVPQRLAKVSKELAISTLTEISAGIPGDDDVLATQLTLLCADNDGGLDGSFVSRLVAKVVLEKCSPCTPTRFLLTWREQCPAQFRSMCQLANAVDLIVQPSSDMIIGKPVLSDQPKTRAEQLFDLHSRWSEEAFVAAGGGVKFARRQQVGKQWFVERR